MKTLLPILAFVLSIFVNVQCEKGIHQHDYRQNASQGFTCGSNGFRHCSSTAVLRTVSPRTKQSGDHSKLRHDISRHGANVLPPESTQRVEGALDAIPKLRNHSNSQLQQSGGSISTGQIPSETWASGNGAHSNDVNRNFRSRNFRNVPPTILEPGNKSKPSPRIV